MQADATPLAFRVDAAFTDDDRIAFTADAIAADGTTSRLTTWAEPAAPLSLTASRSPSGERLAISTGQRLHTLSADGTRESTEPIDGLRGTALITWDGERPVVTDSEGLGVRTAHAGPWALRLLGDLVVDGGISYGHQSGLQLPSLGAERLDEAEAALAAGAASGPTFRLTVALDGGPEQLVHEESHTQEQGRTALHWPPVAGPAGLLLRRSVTTYGIVTREGDPSARALRDDTVIGRPWLIRPDGTVAELPVELGNGPLLALADGRWLLPGNDPLWFDGTPASERLTVLGPDGTLEPFPVQCPPSHALHLHAARLDEDRLLLLQSTENAWRPVNPDWRLLALPVHGAGQPQVLASYTPAGATRSAVAL